MEGEQKSNLHMYRNRRGLLICDMSALLGHKTTDRIERVEKGKNALTIDEAFEIAHILDIDIEAIRFKNQQDVEVDINKRAISHAKTLAKNADQNRFKKRLLWLTNLIMRKNK